jgi:hypothetical protein
LIFENNSGNGRQPPRKQIAGIYSHMPGVVEFTVPDKMNRDLEIEINSRLGEITYWDT